MQLLGGVAIASAVGLGIYVIVTVDVAVRDLRAATRRPLAWLVGLPAMLLVLLVGAPYLYLQSVTTNPPKPLSFADLTAASPSTSTTAGAATSTSAVAPGAAATSAPPTTPDVTRLASAAPDPASIVAGGWVVGRGSQARYHVDDTVMGQRSEVVGSTSDVSGAMTIVDKTVTTTRIVVNMQTIKCNCVHDSKYRDMLDTDVYPTSTFELTRPIALAAIPAEGVVTTVPVTGNFTIHGVTRSVTFTLAAVRQAGRIAVNGKIPVRLEDYNIDNPDAGAFGGLSNCFIEFLVAFDRAR